MLVPISQTSVAPFFLKHIWETPLLRRQHLAAQFFTDRPSRTIGEFLLVEIYKMIPLRLIKSCTSSSVGQRVSIGTFVVVSSLLLFAVYRHHELYNNFNVIEFDFQSSV